LRTRPGEPQNYRDDDESDEGKRRRRSSANRVAAILKAALNLAWRHERVHCEPSWRKLETFRGVDAARVRYLTIAEAKRLLNACPPDFRQIVRAALLTGARYGSLAALTVGDYNHDAGTLRLATRKGNGSLRVFHVHLSDEARQFFDEVTAGRPGGEIMLRRDDGRPWKASHQIRPIENASTRARISPPANFHICRHTFCSHAVMSGAPLLVVAQALGHTDTRMVERHYGHLAPSYAASMIRKHAPSFGTPKGKLYRI
jgi:integrase